MIYRSVSFILKNWTVKEFRFIVQYFKTNEESSSKLKFVLFESVHSLFVQWTLSLSFELIESVRSYNICFSFIHRSLNVSFIWIIWFKSLIKHLVIWIQMKNEWFIWILIDLDHYNQFVRFIWIILISSFIEALNKFVLRSFNKR